MNRWGVQVLCLSMACLVPTFFAVYGQLQSSGEPRLGPDDATTSNPAHVALSQSQAEVKAILKAQPGQIVARNAEPDILHPIRDVQVSEQMDLDDPERDLYQRMATILSTSVTVVPDDRWGFYAALAQSPEWTIERWLGLIRDIVAQDDGSYLVTASAEPRLSSSSWCAWADYSEKYLISGDTVTYIGFLDPRHAFGQMPPMVCR